MPNLQLASTGPDVTALQDKLRDRGFRQAPSNGAFDSDTVLVVKAFQRSVGLDTESFPPISEGQSSFNTSPGGHPFDKYDSRTDPGNQGPPDGERFKGRGFVQLTGRTNYEIHGRAIGLGEQLVENPDLANEPGTASQLLASFIKSREVRLENALAAGDLALARQLVNGGSNGLDRFTDAFNRGSSIIPDSVSA
jgi:putative chitinase